jgi:hypothetical protein
MRVLRCRARLADRHGTRLANSKGSLVKSPHRILSITRCVVSIRSSTCCAVVIALRMQTRATANGTDGKRTQHLALCDDGGDERQRGPASNAQALVDLGQHRRRHHVEHPQHLEHGLELLSCTCSPSSSSTLTADLARCEPSKLCSVEPPRSRPSAQALANAPARRKSAAAPRSRANCRSRPRTRSCSGLASASSYSSIALTRCRRPAEHHAQIKLSRTGEGVLLLDARRRGQRRRQDARHQVAPAMLVSAFVVAVLVLLRTREVDD